MSYLRFTLLLCCLLLCITLTEGWSWRNRQWRRRPCKKSTTTSTPTDSTATTATTPPTTTETTPTTTATGICTVDVVLSTCFIMDCPAGDELPELSCGDLPFPCCRITLGVQTAIQDMLQMLEEGTGQVTGTNGEVESHDTSTNNVYVPAVYLSTPQGSQTLVRSTRDDDSSSSSDDSDDDDSDDDDDDC